MGRFFTSTQIYNSNLLGSKDFIDMFCDKMSKVGYVPCNSDESELSYMLKFVDNCKWVTITSKSYEQGNQFAQQDTSRIAKMLKTACINNSVIDSDCAIFELYDEKGEKADSLIIGRADDYFCDDIPQPSEKIWKQFLCNDSTWEQFTEICNADETFVEDALSELAEIIEMNNENILFSADDANEDDVNTIFLNFKKAKPSIKMSQSDKVANKAPKKLTLTVAFKQVFGELLEPMGFKLVKSKYPYYMRMVGEGIIQAISFSKKKSLDLDLNRNEEGVEIYVGIDLLINPLINFDKNPTIVDHGF